MYKIISILFALLFLISCNDDVEVVSEGDVVKPVQAQLDAYNNRDVEEFSKWFAEDVELRRLQSDEVFCTSREQLVQIYGDMFKNSPELHCELVNRIICGEVVIDEEQVTGIRGGEHVHATAIYEVKNGLIQRAWFVKE